MLTIAASKFTTQVLQKYTEMQRNKKNNSTSSSQFVLPQMLVCIFKFLAKCDTPSREKILRDLLDLLDSNPSNIEALMVLLKLLFLCWTIKYNITTNVLNRKMLGRPG